MLYLSCFPICPWGCFHYFLSLFSLYCWNWINSLFNPHLRTFFFIAFRERGRKRERQKETWVQERNINWLPSRTCPDQESNPQLFNVWDDTPTNWATPPRAKLGRFYCSVLKLTNFFLCHIHSVIEAMLFFNLILKCQFGSLYHSSFMWLSIFVSNVFVPLNNLGVSDTNPYAVKNPLTAFDSLRT